MKTKLKRFAASFDLFKNCSKETRKKLSILAVVFLVTGVIKMGMGFGANVPEDAVQGMFLTALYGLIAYNLITNPEGKYDD